MPRRVKEFVHIKDHLPLDQLIEKLAELKSELPAGSDPELRLSGDDVFGRKLAICYYRELTKAEVELEARYAAATLEQLDVRIERLREQLEVINQMQFSREPLRAVA
ncbi:MAG: hypothetical protein ABIQ32_12390 [Sphingomicrobium sp.]